MKVKIQISNIFYKIGRHAIFDNCSLNVFDDSFTALVGLSGVGKTLLTKLIISEDLPDSGDILVDGKSVFYSYQMVKEQILQKIGVVMQDLGLFDSMYIWENVSFGLPYHLPKEEKIAIARKALRAVGLDNEELLWEYCSSLSGGMLRRVGCARMLVPEKKILIFDEPTTGLDPITTNIVSSVILACHQSLKSTTVIITHDLDLVKKLCSHVALLHSGSVVWAGKKEEFFLADNKYTHQFITGCINGPLTSLITTN